MIETMFFDFEFQALNLEIEIENHLKDLNMTSNLKPGKIRSIIQSVTDNYKRLLQLKVSYYNDLGVQYDDEYSIKTKIDILMLSRKIISFIGLAIPILITDREKNMALLDQLTYLYYDAMDTFVQAGSTISAIYTELGLDFPIKDELNYYNEIIESMKVEDENENGISI